MLHRKKIEGIVMVVLAAICFWLPQHMQKPGAADQKILVATPSLGGGQFSRAVILVVQSNGYGARGFILNGKPENGVSPAGPVNIDTYYTLHSLDRSNDETEKLDGIQVGLTEGEDFVRAMGNGGPKPSEYAVFKGYSGWKMGQLEDELERDMWKVISFDRDIVFHTDPSKMFDAASRK